MTTDKTHSKRVSMSRESIRDYSTMSSATIWIKFSISTSDRDAFYLPNSDYTHQRHDSFP